jgi:hypothetical protein
MNTHIQKKEIVASFHVIILLHGIKMHILMNLCKFLVVFPTSKCPTTLEAHASLMSEI